VVVAVGNPLANLTSGPLEDLFWVNVFNHCLKLRILLVVQCGRCHGLLPQACCNLPAHRIKGVGVGSITAIPWWLLSKCVWGIFSNMSHHWSVGDETASQQSILVRIGWNIVVSSQEWLVGQKVPVCQKVGGGAWCSVVCFVLCIGHMQEDCEIHYWWSVGADVGAVDHVVPSTLAASRYGGMAENDL